MSLDDFGRGGVISVCNVCVCVCIYIRKSVAEKFSEWPNKYEKKGEKMFGVDFAG